MLQPVEDDNDEERFLDVARVINARDPNWVCPLDQDIKEVFDPQQNSYFGHGEAQRWILWSENGELIGRIAAFIDYKSCHNGGISSGACGFFECINDQHAANTLFDAARDWLKERGMEAMDGPINFGEADKFWGCLIEGFSPPAYQVAYNPPYYRELFENYGFKTFFEQKGFIFDLTKPIPERFWKIAEWVTKRPNIHFEHFKWQEKDRYAREFTQVFNVAWKDLKEDFEPMKEEYVHEFLEGGKMVLEPKMIWFAYHDNEPIAIFFMYPDFNQLFKGFKGKLNLWNKLKLFYRLKTKKMDRARGVLMGVVPAFQGRGMESGFIYHLEKVFREELTQYKELEFSWVGDFNPPMRKLWTEVGAEPAKRYITYRYLFDPDRPFERYPIPEE
ncbi:MAG: hypothetical protein ABEH38_08880 [Flavobacteriales bacterium]